jgi:hypothetical protein
MEANDSSADSGNIASGLTLRIPYQAVREIVFSNLTGEDLIDPEHAARLQYRLLLKEAVINATVDFAQRRILVTYNPDSATNRMEKTNADALMDFITSEGVHVSEKNTKEKELDYYNDVFLAQYNPPSVREAQPYGYTSEEWQKMKKEYQRKKAEVDSKNKEKFRDWQVNYLKEHPDLAAELSGNSKK